MLKILQGQHIHTLLHPYSALSLTDNLPVLSEGRIFTTGRQQPALRTVMHMLRTDPANKPRDAESTGSCVQRVHNSPECRLYRWSMRIKRRYAVLKGRRERDIVRPPLLFKLHQRYRPLTRFIREFNPASQEIWSGPVGMQTSNPYFKIPFLKSGCSDSPVRMTWFCTNRSHDS